MDSIPRPEVLDAHRVSRDDREDMTAEDHRSQAQLLASALNDSCAYAQQLWDDLNAMRSYLYDSLPPAPAVPGTNLVVGASPSGPDDENGWESWINAYAEVTSVLCGPHGDSGYGASEARLAAQFRRRAPVPSGGAEHPTSAPLSDAATSTPGNSEAPPSGSAEPPERRASGALVPFSGGVAAGATVALLLSRPWRRHQGPVPTSSRIR